MASRNIVDILIRARDQASGALAKVRGQVGRLEDSTRSTRASFAALTGPSAAAAAAVGGFVAAGVGAGLQAVRLAGQLEQAQIAFTTMLGSAEAADAFLRDMADFAAATPFEFQGLQNSSRLLLAFGFQAEAVLPIVETLGDATSALGGGTDTLEGVVRALGQIQTKGRVSTEELLQLAERGIPVFDILREKLNLTNDQVADIGRQGISSSEAITAILEGLGERFGGAMQAQSRTLLGLWSTVKDTASLTMTEIGRAITEGLNLKPALDAVIEQLERVRQWASTFDLREWASENQRAIELLAGAIAGMLLPSLIAAARAAIRFATPLAALGLAGALVVDVARKMGVQFDDLVKPGAVIPRVASALSGLYDVFDGLTSSIAFLIQGAIQGFNDWGQYLRGWIQWVSGLAQAVASGQRAAIDGVLAAFDPGGWWERAFQGLDEQTLALIDDANAKITSGAQKIKDAFTGDVQDGFNAFGVTVSETLTDTAAKVTDWAALLGGDASDSTVTLKNAAEDAAGAVDQLGAAAGTAADAWRTALEAIGATAGTWVRRAIGLEQPENPIVAAGREIVAALIRGFDAAFPDLAERIGAALQAGRDLARRNAPVVIDPLGDLERRRAAGAQAFDESPTLWRPAGGLPPAFDHAAAQAAEAAARREVERFLTILNRGLQGGPRTGVPVMVDISELAADIAAGVLRGAREDARGARVAFDAQNQARFGTEAGRDAFMQQVWSDPRGFGPRRTLTPPEVRAGLPTPVALTTDGVRAEVPAPVALGDPGVGVVVTPDRSQLPEDVRAHILRQELDARQDLVDRLTTITADKGPIANFGAALLGVAAEQVPAFAGALQGFVQGGVAGAVVGFFTTLMGESEGFAELMAAVNAALEPVAAALGAVVEAAMPLITPLLELFEVVAAVVRLVGQVLAPVFSFLGTVIGGVVDAIITVWNILLGWIPGLRIDRDARTDPPPEAPWHSDQPPTVPEVDFSRVAPGVQLAVATPLLRAADLQVSAASSMQAATKGFGDVVETFGAYVAELVERGVTMHPAAGAPAGVSATSSVAYLGA